MRPNSCWKSSAFFLIVIAAFGWVNTSAGQDLSAENLRRLGRNAFEAGRYSDAERELRLALEEFGRGKDSFEIAQTLGDLAGVENRLTKWRHAQEEFVPSLRTQHR